MTINVFDLFRVQRGDGTDKRIRPDGVIAQSSTTQGNGADTTNDVLFVLPINAGYLDKNGNEINIQCIGDFGATANNKTFQCYVGPTAQTLGAAINATGMTLIGASGTVTTNNLGWSLQGSIFKYGGRGSNTQKAQCITIASTAFTAAVKTLLLTLNESVINYVVLTGSSGTTGAANDVVGQFCQLSIQNGQDPPG